ncbi:hypothetical protein [Acidipropionibacterium jensenii]|uniref:hypothetical protein n=1 Tax=Acidipropionibacterium jensenii TaxID=1749 RepID=UPI00214D0F18|nr:hypothetical protein [Acidipropionibacterium jensenii]
MITFLNQQLALVPTGAWDLLSMLKNSKNYTVTAGGLFLVLLGTVAFITGGVFLLLKFMGGPQQQQKHGWGTVIALLLLGGAVATGGYQLMKTVTSGAQATVTKLGGGDIVTQLSMLPGIPGLF